MFNHNSSVEPDVIFIYDFIHFRSLLYFGGGGLDGGGGGGVG